MHRWIIPHEEGQKDDGKVAAAFLVRLLHCLRERISTYLQLALGFCYASVVSIQSFALLFLHFEVDERFIVGPFLVRVNFNSLFSFSMNQILKFDTLLVSPTNTL